ncbi:hypothetical protein QX201_011816 [Fusarium graminearum]
MTLIMQIESGILIRRDYPEFSYLCIYPLSPTTPPPKHDEDSLGYTCSGIVPPGSCRQIMYDILDSETLSKVCHERYYTSLKEFRAKVVSACNTEMDAVAFKRKNTIFPPTYMVDLLLLSYEVYCYQDLDTGKFCDLQLAEWRNHRESDKPLRCEDCLLGPQRVQLQAPIGYDQDDADKFHDLTSSCSATGYEYATPTQYATGSTDCSGPGDHDDYVVVPRLHLPLE